MFYPNLVAGFFALLSYVMLVSCHSPESKTPPAPSEHQEAAKLQYTFSIVKPDAVAANHVGEIIARFEKGGLKVAALKSVKLSQEQARKLYAIHRERPFYEDLVTFMTSGPIVTMVLQGPDAVARVREIMGSTDPKKASPGTIRADFGTSVTYNAVHGSDSVENAEKETAFFFSGDEIDDRFFKN